MFIVLLAAFIVFAVMILGNEKSKKENAAAQAEKSMQTINELSRSFWPGHPLYKDIVSWIDEQVQIYENKAKKEKLSADDKKYLKFNVHNWGIAEEHSYDVRQFSGVEYLRYDFASKGYDKLTDEKYKALAAALYAAVKRKYGSSYPVALEDNCVCLRVDSAHSKLKKV